MLSFVRFCWGNPRCYDQNHLSSKSKITRVAMPAVPVAGQNPNWHFDFKFLSRDLKAKHRPVGGKFAKEIPSWYIGTNEDVHGNAYLVPMFQGTLLEYKSAVYLFFHLAATLLFFGKCVRLSPSSNCKAYADKHWEAMGSISIEAMGRWGMSKLANHLTNVNTWTVGQWASVEAASGMRFTDNVRQNFSRGMAIVVEHQFKKFELVPLDHIDDNGVHAKLHTRADFDHAMEPPSFLVFPALYAQIQRFYISKEFTVHMQCAIFLGNDYSLLNKVDIPGGVMEYSEYMVGGLEHGGITTMLSKDAIPGFVAGLFEPTGFLGSIDLGVSLLIRGMSGEQRKATVKRLIIKMFRGEDREFEAEMSPVQMTRLQANLEVVMQHGIMASPTEMAWLWDIFKDSMYARFVIMAASFGGEPVYFQGYPNQPAHAPRGATARVSQAQVDLVFHYFSKALESSSNIWIDKLQLAIKDIMSTIDTSLPGNMADGSNGYRLEWGFWWKYHDKQDGDEPEDGFLDTADNLQSPWPSFEGFLRKVCLEFLARVHMFPVGRLTYFKTSSWVSMLKSFWNSWGNVTCKVALSRRPQHPELLEKWCNLVKMHNYSLNSHDYMAALQHSEHSTEIRKAMRTWGGFPRIHRAMLLRFIAGDIGVNAGNPPNNLGVFVATSDRLTHLKLQLKEHIENPRAVSSHVIRGTLDVYISLLEGEFAFGVPLNNEAANFIMPHILALLAFETMAVSQLPFSAELVSPAGAELIGTQVSYMFI